MVGEKIAKQMLDLQKATVDQSFITIQILQDHSEKIMKSFMEQATWIPDEGKQAVNGWINAVKKNEDDCKQMINDYFSSVEHFFLAQKTTEKPAKTTPAKTTPAKTAATKA